MDKERFKYIKKANIAGIIGNIFLLIIKFVVGIMSKSQAMISDAVNSAGDIFATLMSSVGEKIARVPKDESHNFGHGKAEYIFSLIISLSMMAVSIKLIYDSFLSIIYSHSVSYHLILIIVCLITICVKIFLYFYTKRLKKKANSILIESLQKDHRNDAMLTICTLISVFLNMFNINYFDGVVGIVISIVIFISGVKIFISSFNILMDKSIDEKTKQIILEIINKYSEIKKVGHFNSTPVGYKYLISISIFVDGNLSTFDSHKIADTLEKELNSLEKIYLSIIHVNPL